MNNNIHENPFNNISPQKEDRPSFKKSETGSTRRDFLKGLFAASALAIAGKTIVDLNTPKETGRSFYKEDEIK